MNSIRRTLVAAIAGLAAAALAAPLRALAAWNKEGFGAKTAADALKAINAGGAAPSTALRIEAPEIAENGAVVPIEIESAIPGTTALSVVIDKNPFPLIGQFQFLEGALPFVKVNVKMGETSEVRVIAQAGGKSYVATKEIKVTIGGCGG